MLTLIVRRAIRRYGGIWPFVSGFYVAALVKAGRLAEAHDNRRNSLR